MQLGFVSALFADLSVEQVLTLAAEEGFDCVELICWPSEGDFAGPCHVDADALSTDTPRHPRRVADLAERLGIQISGLGYYPNPLSANEREAAVARDHLPRVMDAAVTMGVPIVNTFIGANSQLSIEANLELFREHWPQVVAEAGNRGLKLAIENCPMLFPRSWPGGGNLARSPRVWREMFSAIPAGHFGLNYDPSHLIWQLIDPYEPLGEFRDRIFHVHAKDTHVDQAALKRLGWGDFGWHIAKLPGLGDLDWGRWLGGLYAIGYEGAVCIEVEDTAFEGDYAHRRRALQLSRNILRPFLA